MSLLSRRSLFAVAAVLDVALHARPAPVSARALAARHGLGPRHLEAVLQALVRGGILKGMRGPRGGYELARERRRVSVGDIVRAAERASIPGDPAIASDLVATLVLPALRSAEEAFLERLDDVTVADLCARAGTEPATTSILNFTI